MASKDYDWRTLRDSGHWEYKGDAPDDPEYIKDRNSLFEEHGNGWWIYAGHPSKWLPRWWKKD